MTSARDADERARVVARMAPKVVSIGALAVAVIHIVFPALQIDATTLALLGIAAVPWLAPVLKSITLPGGFELVLQDLKDEVGNVKEQVQESSRRVDDLASKVEELLFVGEPVDAGRREEISQAIADFRDFLSTCGLPVPAANPTVRVDPENSIPYYVPGPSPEIHIGKDTSAEMTYRIYAHHVLGSVYEGRPGTTEQMGVQYGLGFYFTGSYAKSAPTFGGSLADRSLRHVIEDTNDRPSVTGDSDNPLYETMGTGAAWARTFWELRNLVPPQEADRILGNAWVRSVGRRGDFRRVFSKQLLDLIRSVGASDAAEAYHGILRAEGVRT